MNIKASGELVDAPRSPMPASPLAALATTMEVVAMSDKTIAMAEINHALRMRRIELSHEAYPLSFDLIAESGLQRSHFDRQVAMLREQRSKTIRSFAIAYPTMMGLAP